MFHRHVNFSSKIMAFLKSPFAYTLNQHAPDFIFIGALGMMLAFGLMLLSSASSVQSYQQFGDSYYLFKHQLIKGFLPGLMGFYIFSRIDYRVWKKWAFWMLFGTIMLLVAVFLPNIGESYDKTRSWVNLGLFSFQPTELVKLTFLIYLATWIEKKGLHGLKDPQYGLLPFAFVLCIISFLVLAQPDTGTLVIIIMLALAVYFIGNGPFKYFSMMLGGFIIMVLIAIQVAPYRLQRITAFLNPDMEPQGMGYQINQAKIAVGSGGIFGLGIGKSRQKFSYLPQVYGDSIFAVVAEEMGFIFSSLMIGLFLLIFWRGFAIARASPDQFSKLLSAGITCWIVFQAFINIGGIIGILPLTGVPLPFVSYGGTAEVVSLLACGILVNISKQTRPRQNII